MGVLTVHTTVLVYMCVRFLQRRALVFVCWSVDGVSSDCSDKRETQTIGLREFVAEAQEMQTNSVLSEGGEGDSNTEALCGSCMFLQKPP